MTQYKLGTPYDEYVLGQVTKALAPKVEAQEGTSGYWSQPDTGLDQRLVDPSTEKVREDVRSEVLKTLYEFWSRLYNDPQAWSTVWIAGSALSHQYQEHQQPDLDVLIGVDYGSFYEHNPEFQGVSQAALSERFNAEFREYLAPSTLNFMGTFEATFYVNPGATDIRSINPYAAFNLTTDEWTVKPIDVPEQWNPREFFPAGWFQTLDTEVHNAQTLVDQYAHLADRVRTAPLGSIQQTSALVQLRQVAQRATSSFMDIHGKRKLAFSATGKGYFDYNNLRWQVHKRAGTVKALHEIAVINQGAKAHEENALYGEHIDDPATALVKSQLFQTGFGAPAWYRKRLGT